MAENIYMKRTGNRAATAMKMRNEYSEQFGIQYYLIVEGKSDEHFYENIVDYQKCKVMNLEGKENVKEFITERNSCGKKGYLGIVDADFEHITKYEPKINNVLLTDHHDMEMMIFYSRPNMRRIYSELSENILIHNYEKTSGKEFIRSILEVSYEIGLFKMIMAKYKVNADIPYELVNDKFEVDMDELIKRSIKRHQSKYEIMNEIEIERKKHHDLFQVCCGHDVTEILRRSFVSVNENGLGYGNNNNRLNKERIEGLLRAIYEFKHFMSTKLYVSIVEWEKKNDIEILDRSVFVAA